jgi:hypothetical protein
MAFRRRKQAKIELAEFMPVFETAIADGYRRFWARDDITVLEKGTRSRVIRDYIAAELRIAFDGQRGVHIDDSNQTTLFCIGQNWAIQVHKLDDAGEVAKNYTQLSMDLRSNEIDQESLPNVPEAATVLFLGYVESGDPEHPDMRLVCPGDAGKTWMIELGGAAPGIEDITPIAAKGDEPGTRIVVSPAGRRRQTQ